MRQGACKFVACLCPVKPSAAKCGAGLQSKGTNIDHLPKSSNLANSPNGHLSAMIPTACFLFQFGGHGEKSCRLCANRLHFGCEVAPPTECLRLPCGSRMLWSFFPVFKSKQATELMPSLRSSQASISGTTLLFFLRKKCQFWCVFCKNLCLPRARICLHHFASVDSAHKKVLHVKNMSPQASGW